MLIVIPSKARATKQTTFENMPPVMKGRITILVEHEQAPSYIQAGYSNNLLIMPPHIKGISWSRQWLVNEALNLGHEKLVMMDDDLVFAKRRDDDLTKFRTPTDLEIPRVFDDIEEALDHYAHVSVSPREGGNRRTEPFCLNTRTMRVLGYNLKVLEKEELLFTFMELMEDFYMNLCLLTRGYENCSINWMVQNQNGSDLPGGCSTFRTLEMHQREAEKLAQVFPQFVTLVRKQTKTAWGGRERTDVVIQWKKALEYGRSQFGPQSPGTAKEALKLLDSGAAKHPE